MERATPGDAVPAGRPGGLRRLLGLVGEARGRGAADLVLDLK
jgi:hypothetical protein